MKLKFKISNQTSLRASDEQSWGGGLRVCRFSFQVKTAAADFREQFPVAEVFLFFEIQLSVQPAECWVSMAND